MDLNQKIIVSLERISQAFRVLLWNEGKKYGLSPIQIQILHFIHSHSAEKCKISYLAKEFDMTKATISDSVKALFQKSLVRKEPEPQDTRSFSIHLTKDGEEIVQNTIVFMDELDNSLKRFGQSEKENLLVNLLGMIDSLHQSGVITLQRMCFTCSHYASHFQESPHYCQLLQKQLNGSDLQIDCPEHQWSETV